jgi:hypothetical protein
MSATAVPDARRWLAFHSIGGYELLMEIQGSLEDLLGAARAGQDDVARYAARLLVLRCLAVRALLADGSRPDLDDCLYDPFAGLPEEVVGHGLSLARDVARAEGDLTVPVERLAAYVRALERDLGFREPPPSVRRPDGLYPALRVARELLPLNQASGFPTALPTGWLPKQSATAEPTR